MKQQKYQRQPSIGGLIKGVLKFGSIFTRKHLCQSVFSIKLQIIFIEITLFLKTPVEGCPLKRYYSAIEVINEGCHFHLEFKRWFNLQKTKISNS